MPIRHMFRKFNCELTQVNNNCELQKSPDSMFLNNLDFYFEESLNGLTLNYVIQPLNFYFYHRINPN